MSTDPVSNPGHYHRGNHEAIDVIEAWGLGFNLGNAVKYIARHALKGRPLEDLKKARWYLDRAISKLEAEAPPKVEQLGARSGFSDVALASEQPAMQALFRLHRYAMEGFAQVDARKRIQADQMLVAEFIGRANAAGVR